MATIDLLEQEGSDSEMNWTREILDARDVVDASWVLMRGFCSVEV